MLVGIKEKAAKNLPGGSEWRRGLKDDGYQYLEGTHKGLLTSVKQI